MSTKTSTSASARIVTVTLNPSIDMTVGLDHLERGRVNLGRSVTHQAGGKGVNEKMEHCASLTGGRPGVLHGNRTYLLQDDDGQILEGFSISAGLDYPGIRPEHAWMHDIGRAQYVSITDV